MASLNYILQLVRFNLIECRVVLNEVVRAADTDRVTVSSDTHSFDEQERTGKQHPALVLCLFQFMLKYHEYIRVFE